MRQLPKGVLPVLATPFTDNGDLDLGALASEIDFVIDQQVDGVVLGMVSEVLRLSSEERETLTEATCRAVAGRVSVTASVGAESLHTAIRYARHAEAAGADAVMAIPPMGTSCGDAELYAYYSQIIESIEIPVVVQDASGYLGRPLTIEMQSNLFSQFGDHALFKPEAQPIGPRLTQLLEATGGAAKVYEGTGDWPWWTATSVASSARCPVRTSPGPLSPCGARWKAETTPGSTRSRARSARSSPSRTASTHSSPSRSTCCTARASSPTPPPAGQSVISLTQPPHVRWIASSNASPTSSASRSHPNDRSQAARDVTSAAPPGAVCTTTVTAMHAALLPFADVAFVGDDGRHLAHRRNRPDDRGACRGLWRTWPSAWTCNPHRRPTVVNTVHHSY